jgi:hypothetical protein
MSITYDPDKTPDVDPESSRIARQLGMFPINVICDEPDAQPGDHTGVGFMAFVDVVPRIGERITLQDGNKFTVTNIYHRVVKDPDSDFITMMPNVVGRRIH